MKIGDMVTIKTGEHAGKTGKVSCIRDMNAGVDVAMEDGYWRQFLEDQLEPVKA